MKNILIAIIVFQGIVLGCMYNSFRNDLIDLREDLTVVNAKLLKQQELTVEAYNNSTENFILITNTLEYEYKMDQLEEVNELLQRVVDEGFLIQ